MNIYNKNTTIKELIKLYSGLRFEFSDLLKKLQQEYSWDEKKDTRIVAFPTSKLCASIKVCDC